MCLHRIIGKPEKTSGIGYKAFRGSGLGKLWFPYYNPDGTDTFFADIQFIELNKKYKSTKKNEDAIHGKKYKTGFHVFVSRKSAEAWGKSHGANVIAKIRYSKARLTGLQTRQVFEGERGSKCIIADEITLLEIINP